MTDEVARTGNRFDIAEMLEAAHEAYVAIDEYGVITAWNREAERTFGWARQVAVGSLLRDLNPPRPRDRLEPRRGGPLRLHR